MRGWLPVATSCWPRSTPCTPTRGMPAPPTGRRSLALYDRMVRLDPSPIVALNRAIAIAELRGPQEGLAEIDRLGDALDGYHALHAARAELLRRLGRDGESRTAYDRAIALTGNTAEIAYLTRRRDELG